MAASTPIRGRDYKAYEQRVQASKSRPLTDPYLSESELPEAKGSTSGTHIGTQALFNRYATFYYAGPYGANNSKAINYFQDDTEWDFNKVERNPTAAKLIEWSRSPQRNAIEYSWEDFLWCKHYGKIPNNYMITLRRFGVPVEDNIINKERTNTPDLGRLICWIDGDKNKLEDLLKFSVKLKWKEFKSEIQTLSGQGYGGSGGNSLIGKILGATDTAGANTARKGLEASNMDPYSNMTNKTLGPINVIDKMMVRDRGLEFTQQIVLTFEYEMRSIDGINGKIAFLDLLMNVLQVTYNRGDFWGGANRYVGGARKSNPIAGQDGMQKLANGDWGGFLDALTTGFSNRINDLTGGKGLSLEGLGNALKSVGGNVASRMAGNAMDKMGRPQAQATQALLTGDDTGEWHITVGNPARPILSLGNMILESTDIQFFGPLDINDFPTKLVVKCTLKPARPRDRDDVQMMFAPNNQERLYGTAMDYVKKTYYGQVGPNFGPASDPTRKQNPLQAYLQNDPQFSQQEQNNFENILRQRFPNFASGIVDNKRKWTT